jgi:predicted HicB family RNase H-like nuclease
MQSYERVNLALPKDLAEWIKQQAKRENRSINNFIKTIIIEKKLEKENPIKCLSVQ